MTFHSTPSFQFRTLPGGKTFLTRNVSVAHRVPSDEEPLTEREELNGKRRWESTMDMVTSDITACRDEDSKCVQVEEDGGLEYT
jgi:hypothetical protein